MLLRHRILIASLLTFATSHAQAAPPPAEPVTSTSYRAQTLTVDGIGLAMLIAADLSEGEHGRDTSTSDTLFTLGHLTMLFGAPIVHGVRGHGGRAAASIAMRLGLASVGMAAALSANADCDDGQPPQNGALFDDDFLCELDYVGYGILGGLAVATLLDAAFMTDETIETPRRQWAPQLSATRDGGLRAGVVFTW